MKRRMNGTPERVEAYVKDKNDRQMDTYEKQRKSRNYFKKINMNGYEPEKKINSYHVVDEEECMNKCMEESCESFLFMRENDKPYFTPEEEDERMHHYYHTKKDIQALQNRKYTDCFRNDFDQYQHMQRRINMECKKKYGDGYLFVNDLSVLDSILPCEDPLSVKGECQLKLNQTTPIEFFENKMSQSNRTSNGFSILWMIIFLLLILILLYFCIV